MSIRRSWSVLLSHPAVRYPNIKCRRAEFFPGGLSYAAQGGPSTCARCRDPSPGWHGVRMAIRINSIRISQEDMWRAPLSGLPQGEVPGTRDHHTPDDSISYPDMLSGSLTNVSKPCYSPCSTALRWCVRTPCPDIFYREDWTRTQSGLKACVHLAAMVLHSEYSLHSGFVYGFQRTLLNLGLLW